jgi:hypothetical protein
VIAVRWILLGAVLAVLLLVPQTLTAIAAVAAALVSQPVLVAFTLGALARPHMRTPKGWWTQ